MINFYITVNFQTVQYWIAGPFKSVDQAENWLTLNSFDFQECPKGFQTSLNYNYPVKLQRIKKSSVNYKSWLGFKITQISECNL